MRAWFLLFLAGFTGIAHGQTYTVTDLGTGYRVDGYRRKVINDAGEVLGTKIAPAFRAHLFSGGSWHDLGEINPSGTTDHRTIGAGLNNLGWAVGEGDAGGDGGQRDGFLSTGVSGTISRLNVVSGTTVTDDGAAAAVNDLGAIVGTINHGATGVRESFVFRSGTGVTATLAGVDLFAINNFGDTLGEAGIIAPQQLLNGNPLPPTAAGFIAQSLNHAGQIVLSVDGDTSINGVWGLIFDYNTNKVVAKLPNLSVQSVGYTSFRSINDHGQVVGRGADEVGGAQAIFYSKDRGLVSLDALNLTSGGSAVHLTSAEGINNLGQVVCVGTLGVDPTEHVFLLTPDTAPAPNLVAAYSGIASVGGMNVGSVSVMITKTNGFSVKLVAPGVSYSFKEVLTADAFSGTVTVKGVALTVNLVANAAERKISGTIADGTQTYAVNALRQVKLGIFTGKYTALFQLAVPNGALPQGIGHGKMSVSKSGAIKISGLLGDGAKYSAAAVPRFDGTWAFYAPLYAKSPQPGGIAGVMTFDRAAADSDCAGTLKWNKPGDFAADVTCRAALFKAVKDTQLLRFTNTTDGAASFAFAGGEQSLAAHTLAVTNKNAVTVTDPGPDELEVKLSSANGGLTGSFIHPVTGKTSFTGVVQQKLNLGGGVFQGQTTAGSVLLTPQ